MADVVPAYIDRFTGEWRFLSNFSPVVVMLDGQEFYTVEGAYQAAKADNAEHRALCRITTPGNAKRLGRKVPLRHDWETRKIDVMRALLRQKFFDPIYKGGLRRTGTSILIEGNDWGDRIWGCVAGPVGAVGNPDYVTDRGTKWFGQNQLGKLLMEIRAELS